MLSEYYPFYVTALILGLSVLLRRNTALLRALDRGEKIGILGIVGALILAFLGLKLKYVSSDITSDMLSNWISRVGSSIPRGFSRHYVLNLLKDAPMTGKEIIDRAVLQSDGKWRPSPGLIYPMLGRLLEEGLIEEAENGRYRITLKGLDMASDVESINNIIQKQLDVMLRFGNVGKFMALDLIDRASAIGTALSSNLDKMTEQEKGKYRQFLVSELKKLDAQELKGRELEIE